MKKGAIRGRGYEVRGTAGDERAINSGHASRKQDKNNSDKKRTATMQIQNLEGCTL